MQITCYNPDVDTPEANKVVGFGKALRWYRRKQGLTQSDLAHVLDVTQTTISDWEGKADPPRDFYIYVDQLAAIFGVDAGVLERGEAVAEPAASVIARPGQETIAEMLRRLAPSPEFAREVERFMRLSLENSTTYTLK